jgi:hypothetical protein
VVSSTEKEGWYIYTPAVIAQGFNWSTRSDTAIKWQGDELSRSRLRGSRSLEITLDNVVRERLITSWDYTTPPLFDVFWKS